MTLDELAGRLRTALQGRSEVRLAFLFGSTVTRGVDSAEDVDVAVSFAGSLSLLEQCALASRLEEVVGREVDLVDLDQASTLLRWEVARSGVLLSARDPREVTLFRARVPLEYFDLKPYLEREAEGLRRVLERSRWSSSTS